MLFEQSVYRWPFEPVNSFISKRSQKFKILITDKASDCLFTVCVIGSNLLTGALGDFFLVILGHLNCFPVSPLS